jgi:hypothetical protein
VEAAEAGNSGLPRKYDGIIFIALKKKNMVSYIFMLPIEH